MTYEQALAIAGSEDALKSERDDKTVENWRTSRGTGKRVVPATALVKFLLERDQGSIDETAALIVSERDAAYRAGREEARRELKKLLA